MIKHNIIIVEFDSLYKVLSEIRDNFTFEIKNCVKKSDFSTIANQHSVFISKLTNKDFLKKEKNIDLKDIIFFLEKKDEVFDLEDSQRICFPTNIYNLIEKININLIKKKYNFQSDIKISNYFLDLNSRTLSNDKNNLKLTEKEIDIILFLKNTKKPQKVANLQNEVWNYSTELETHTVETHIYRLRKKIKDAFKDDDFLISNKNGYLIK